MPGGSDPTVGIHNLAYPICYMRAYINKSSRSMRIWNALIGIVRGLSPAQSPPTRRHRRSRIGDVGHEVGGRAQSALAADELGGGRLSESADATDA